MNRYSITTLALCAILTNNAAHAMFCQVARQQTKHTPQHINLHRPFHATANTNAQRTIKISHHCLNKLDEIDRNLPAFLRYLKLKLEDETLQEEYAGRPSLIIEKYKNKAPMITKFHDAAYLDHYLPDTYKRLDAAFEEHYNDPHYLQSTKQRIHRAFWGLNFKESLQTLTQQATNNFKLHIISQDRCPAEITISLDNGNHVSMRTPSSQE